MCKVLNADGIEKYEWRKRAKKILFYELLIIKVLFLLRKLCSTDN